jgi:hypothetical protein
MRQHAQRLGWFLILVAALLVQQNGCVQSPPAPARSHSGFQPGDLPQAKGNAPAQPLSPDQLTAKDRCPARLHEIEGALLEYYVDHRDLPANLQQLQPYVPNLPMTCPDSNLPYVYVPAGLRKPGGTKRIIIHDPVRNADGTRWCIMLADHKPGKPQETEVIQLPEPLFLAYQ